MQQTTDAALQIAVAVLEDPNKFASDRSIAEQTAQTLREVLGDATATSDDTIDASTTALQQARSRRDHGAISARSRRDPGAISA